MAYRGGNIDIVVAGDSTWNLDEHDFIVLVYPDRHPEKAKRIDKADMKSIGNGRYSGSVSYKETKSMDLGYYTTEVLIKEDESSRCVFARVSAFMMHDSAAKNIE